MRKLAFSILLAACSASDPKLPSATFTPHLDSQETSVACGADFSFSNSATTLRYGYTYDSAGRLVAGTGTWSPSAVVDNFAYTYSGNNFDSYVWTSGWDGSQEAVDAGYDANDNLVAYAYSYSDGTNTDTWSYAYSSFLGPNQPAHEDITHGTDPAHFYDFVYDADNRLVQANPDVGAPWTWTYDDAARTITSDLNNGEIHGVQTYDADFRPLSETWGGTNTDVIPQSTTYAWDDDRLLTVSSTYGTDSQLETLRYDCSAARTSKGVMAKVMKPRAF